MFVSSFGKAEIGLSMLMMKFFLTDAIKVFPRLLLYIYIYLFKLKEKYLSLSSNMLQLKDWELDSSFVGTEFN